MHVLKRGRAGPPLVAPLRHTVGDVHHAVQRHALEGLHGRDSLEKLKIGTVRLLFVPVVADLIVDQDRHSLGFVDAPFKGSIPPGGRASHEPYLRQRRPAPWARELLLHPLGPGLHGLPPEHHLPAAVRARKHLAPHRVVDAALGLAVGVERLVHPADFLLHVVQQLLGRFGELVHVEGDVVVGGDERGRGGQVAQNGPPCAPLGRLAALVLPFLLELAAVLFGRRAAPLGGHAGHSRAAEAVQHDVAGFGVVQDRRDDCQVGHLGVIAVRPVEGIGLAHAHVHGKRLAVVLLGGVVGRAVVLDELG